MQASYRSPAVARNYRPTKNGLLVRASAEPQRTAAPLRVPGDVNTQVKQAVSAIEAAWKAGVKRQRVELLLPLIGATDIDDWPGGIRQQFKAISPMVESILKELKQKDGLQGPLAAAIWDQGDAVGAWTGDNLAAVVFPTGPTLDRVQQLAARQPSPPELLVLFNPQWDPKSYIGANDLGFGQKQQQALSFVDGFQTTYYLRQQRINGDDVRVLRGYPGGWQIHVVTADGSSKLLEVQEERPTYSGIEAVLKTWPESKSNQSWVDRIKGEFKFSIDSLKQPPSQQ